MRPEHWIYSIPLRLRSLFSRAQTTARGSRFFLVARMAVPSAPIPFRSGS
jgi:hypothetical protein